MPELRFEGESDDTFGEVAHTGDDYDCCASGELIVYKVTASGTGLLVTGQYSGPKWPNGMGATWVIGVTLLDEDIPLPSWPMRFECAHDCYSPALIIDAPQGVKIQCLNRE